VGENRQFFSWLARIARAVNATDQPGKYLVRAGLRLVKAQACVGPARRVASDARDSADAPASLNRRERHIRAGWGYAQTGFGGAPGGRAPGLHCPAETPVALRAWAGVASEPHAERRNYPPELNRKILNLPAARIRLEKFTTQPAACLAGRV
jgi:hypothetical protein